MGDCPFHRTGGTIGSLSQLIRGAAVPAIEDGSEAITEEPERLAALTGP
ncbi:hypothetical protein ACWGH4_05760 [Streptomyces sp. NPDC054847]